jgi:hypothetical protein
MATDPDPGDAAAGATRATGDHAPEVDAPTERGGESAPAPGAGPDASRKRPLIERLGLAVIALVLGALFAVVGIASFVGGEPFLGVMGLVGCLMVLWVGGLTLFRG